MQVKTFLNRVYKAKGFVYESIRFRDSKDGRIEVAIPEGATNTVEILLPFDGSPFHTVTVRATDFVGLSCHSDRTHAQR